MTSQRFGFAVAAAALVALGVTGCASKNYVRTQTGPLVTHTDQLDQQAANNNRAIHDVDDRAQAGITKAQSSADSANAERAEREPGGEYGRHRSQRRGAPRRYAGQRGEGAG